jgi:RNA polymerase sigma-70 factor (ECF subfamily)
MSERVVSSTQEELVSSPGDLSGAGVHGDCQLAPRQSFRQIFDEHGAAVGRTLRYLGVREADLTDAAQDVFLVVDRRYVEFEGRSRLGTWIRQICIRVALSYRRRERRRREDVVADPPERTLEPEQHTDAERRQQREVLTRLLDMLDDDLRMIIVLHEIERLPMREVAQAVGCPLQTAYSRRNAALEKLRDELARFTATP